MRREIVGVLKDLDTGRIPILQVDEEVDGEIVTGKLGIYPILLGVPHLYDMGKMSIDQRHTIDSFSAKWLGAPGYREDTDNFYWQWYLDRYAHGNEQELADQIFTASTILDAGTGLGRDAKHFRSMGTRAGVYAVDLSDGIHIAYDRLHHLGINFIRCDIANLPFYPQFFDFISCDQVLHHTSSPFHTLSHLADHLSSSGSLNFYVYKRKAPMREMCDDYLRDITTHYSVDQCYDFSEKIAKIGKQLTEMNQSITVDDIPELGITAGTYDLQRFFYWNFIKMFYNADFSWEDNIAVNFDWYHPACAKRFSRDEVESMVDRAGLRIDSFHESDAGYSVRTVKC